MNRSAAVIFVVMLASYALAGCDSREVSGAEWSALEQRISQTEAFIEANRSLRRQAMVDLAQQPLPELSQACRVANPAVSRGAVELPPWAEVRTIPQLANSAGPLLAAINEKLDEIKSAASRRPERTTKNDYQMYMAAVEAPTTRHDYTVVIDELVEPVLNQVGSQLTFTPGRLAGRIYAWSYADQRVVCAAPLSVTNSNQINVAELSSMVLRGDLYYQALLEGLRNLREYNPTAE